MIEKTEDEIIIRIPEIRISRKQIEDFILKFVKAYNMYMPEYCGMFIETE